MKNNLEILNEVYNKTKGKKTYTFAGLQIAFEALLLIFPDLLNDRQELMTQKVLTFLISYGVLDKVWRDRIKIVNFVGNLFSKKQKS